MATEVVGGAGPHDVILIGAFPEGHQLYTEVQPVTFDPGPRPLSLLSFRPLPSLIIFLSVSRPLALSLSFFFNTLILSLTLTFTSSVCSSVVFHNLGQSKLEALKFGQKDLLFESVRQKGGR